MNSTIEKENKEDNKANAMSNCTITTEIITRTDKKKKSVTWDAINIEEQELEKKLHPVLNKINEPKTPYTVYEEGDDDYLNKLNEINKIKATAEVLNHVSNQLEKKSERKSSGNSIEEYIKIEVVEPDGSIKNEIVSQEHHENKEFSNKRHKIFKNEFTDAKNYLNEHKNDDMIEQTLNNTLVNKFSGKIVSEKDKNETHKINLCAFFIIKSIYIFKMFTHPFFAKTLFSVGSSLVSDIICQIFEIKYEKGENKLKNISIYRLIKYGVLSILMSPIYYYQYNILEPSLFSSEKYIQKMLFDQIICIPLALILFFTLQGLLERKPLKEINEKTIRVLPSVVLSGYKVWPLFMMLTFRFIPQELCEYAINIFATIFGVYLSYKAHCK